mmetsp:Transcript_20052/g.64593  ORF Transcript_20052/g.64593 Transcript_20052/m.64593 type:complete len:849 (+) Transcript_20052:75-2621(+)
MELSVLEEEEASPPSQRRRPSRATWSRRSAVSESIMQNTVHHMQLQALFTICMILVCLVDLYALAPRIAFSGTPIKEPFQRMLFWLQQVSTIVFLAAYVCGATAFHRGKTKRKAEERKHIALRGFAKFSKTHFTTLELDSPLNVITQVVMASAVPLLVDLASLEEPKSRRHWKWVGVMRLLHLMSFFRVFATLDTNLAIPYWLPPTLRNVLLLCFNTHYAACVFWLLAKRKNFSKDTWVSAHADFLIDSSANTQYLYSLYYAVVTASTVGYGDYSPVSSSEVSVMISYILVNVLVVANIVGGVSALATMRDTDIAEQRLRIARFDRMLESEGISKEVALATREYLRLGLKIITFDARCDVDSLPVAVRVRIRHERFGHLLDQLPLFKGVSSRFVSKCVAVAKDDAFVKGLDLAREGDLAARLCLIVDGVASIEVPHDEDQDLHGFDESKYSEAALSPSMDGSRGGLEQRQKQRTLMDRLSSLKGPSGASGFVAPLTAVATVSVGGFFGAESFVCQLQQPWTIVARSLLRVVSFDDNDRRELEATFPNDWFKVRSNLLEATRLLRQRAQRLSEQVSSSSSGGDDHGGAAAFLSSKEGEGDDDTMVVAHVDDLHTCLEAKKSSSQRSSHSAGAIARFAECAYDVEKAVQRETSKASHALSALHCHVAASGDDAELARLLDMVPVQNVPGDYDGRAPLHLACANGHVDSVKILLDAGADKDVVDRFKRTPLMEAVLNGQGDVVSLLVDRGAKLKLRDIELAEHLCSAAATGDLAKIGHYLDAGANPDAADYDERTCLMLAAANGNLPLCHMLIDRGADKTKTDRWGHTAYHEATYHGHTGKIADLLRIQID